MHNDVRAIPALGQIKMIWDEKGEAQKADAESLDIIAFWKVGLWSGFFLDKNPGKRSPQRP